VPDVDPGGVKRPRTARRKGQVEPAQVDTTDAIEIAMKAVATGAVSGSAAQIVLERHAGLLEIQCRREREELSNVRVQWITRWLILIAVAAFILTILALIWNASRTESLVVEPFRVPAALDQAGLSGEVMATQVMDQIALMQSRTLSTRPADSYSVDWGGDINVSIPSTGTTIGDLRRLLRSWFGKETRISGEAVRLGSGWTVTARTSGRNAVSATGAELGPLVAQVAEGVFRQTQPYRYAVYLIGAGRREEAIAVARELALNGPEAERAWGRVAYANALGGAGIGERERLPALRQAAEALPDFPMPIGNHATALATLGRWEEALPLYRQVEAMIGDGAAISEEFRGQYLASKGTDSAQLTGAEIDAAPALEAASRVGTSSYASDYLVRAISSRYRLHDIRAGDSNVGRYGELTGYNRQTGQVATLGTENLDEAERFQLMFQLTGQFLRTRGIGDREAMARDLPSQVRILSALLATIDEGIRRDVARTIWPLIAPELARIGGVAEAEALLAPLEGDCYPCLVARGEVAAAKGDRSAARRWFAEAARRGPSFPFAHEAYGRMLAEAGDLAGASAAFAEASRIQPRWADPLKQRADLLAGAGDHDQAVRLYARAARYAPRWGDLHLAWGQALWRSGRHDEARTQFAAAGTMVLSRAHRSMLDRIRAQIDRRG
jgi:tetratricopeptide (TPR) repeat protein